MSTTGYLWDEAFLGHFTSMVAPERPERADVLNATQMCADLPGLRRLKNDALLGRAWIGRVHDPDYVRLVRGAFEEGRRHLDNGETCVRFDTFDVAERAVSGALSLVREVMEGRIDNGFAALRPPGHHAGRFNARGFCYFNNVAIAARYAQETYAASRVLIVDWDVHPADGTMALFYDDPSVHVLSIHQHGIFTETVGTTDQTGRDAGIGATMNVPLPAGSSEATFLDALESALEVAAGRCRPDLILISCGFDAHRADPIGSMLLDDNSYRKLTRMVAKQARRYCQGRIVSLLEGGYNPEVLRRCTRLHVETLME